MSGPAHLAQSVADILTTPLGTRPMRRDYGSMLFELIDQPMNASLRVLMQAATAIALGRWEARLKVTRVVLDNWTGEGAPVIRIEGLRTDSPRPNERVSLSIPLRPLFS